MGYVAVRILAAELHTEQFATVEDFRVAPLCIESITILVIERLQLLSKAIRGDIDPLLLWCHDNQASPGSQNSPDVVLTAWSTKRRRKKAEADLRRAERLSSRKRRHQ